jgi:DNA polymerase-3 subunit beta
MDITLQVAEFVRELELLEKTASKKPTIPILSNVLLQADPAGGVRLAATDLEVGLITFNGAAVDMPGTTTLHVKRLLDMARLLPAQQMRLTLDSNGSARVTSGKYTARLQTYPAADFPRLPSMKDLKQINLPQAELRAMIQRVQFAVSDKDKRYFMNGALLVFNATGFALVATDGHRLALATCPLAGTVRDPVIIPASTLTKLSELLSGIGDVQFAQTERHLFFVVDGRMLISRLVEGKFPAWERIIPRGENLFSVSLPRETLRAALQRSMITSGDSGTIVFRLKSGELSITSQSAQIGDAAESLDVVYDGVDFTVGFNGNYLLDFLNVVASDAVTLCQKTKDGALLFVDSSDYSYVLMPMRV